MTLEDQLKADLRESMRAGNEIRRDTLRLLLASLHNAQIAAQKALDASSAIAVLRREAKQRRESIEEYSKAARKDLVDREEAELTILNEYLPALMSRSEIDEVARRVISEVGASSPADKGKVMPIIMAELKDLADGREVNASVSDLLAAG